MNKQLSVCIVFYSRYSKVCEELFKNLNIPVISQQINFKLISVDNKYIREKLINNKYNIYCVPSILNIYTDNSIEKYENYKVFDWFYNNIRNSINSQQQQIYQQEEEEKKILIEEYQIKLKKQQIEQEKLKNQLLEKQMESKIRKKIDLENQKLGLKNSNTNDNLNNSINVKNNEKEQYSRYTSPPRDLNKPILGIDNAGVQTAIRKSGEQNVTPLNELDYKEVKNNRIKPIERKEINFEELEDISENNIPNNNNNKRMSVMERARKLEKGRDLRIHKSSR